MSSGIWAAASGAIGQVTLLDTAANNLANLDTNGFMADRLLFRRTLSSAMGPERTDPSLEYAVTRTARPDLRSGRIVPTGRDLDVAIVDDARFFAVDTPFGPRFTRAGSCVVAQDGMLTGPNGTPYLGQGYQPIIVPPGTGHVNIDTNGEVLADGNPTGQRLLVVEFPNPDALRKEGNMMLVAPPEAGPPAVVESPYLQVQALEKVTDRAFEHMSSVMSASRDFEILSQVIQAFRDVEDSAARDISGG
jgi:flagellar basal-body rod protein FlgF